MPSWSQTMTTRTAFCLTLLFYTWVSTLIVFTWKIILDYLRPRGKFTTFYKACFKNAEINGIFLARISCGGTLLESLWDLIVYSPKWYYLTYWVFFEVFTLIVENSCCYYSYIYKIYILITYCCYYYYIWLLLLSPDA